MITTSLIVSIVIIIWLLHVIYVKLTKTEIHYNIPIWFNIYLIINMSPYSTNIEIINLNE